MGTPDALRLNRLDRLINQLGEHQMSIRQQGTSVTDLESRVIGLEKRVSDELQALWPLREVDVQGELTAARASIDKLSKQMALLSRDQEEGRIQSEKRLQQVEARQAEAERQLASVAAALEASACEAAAEMEELRGATKAMLGEFVSRIADQFDALQAALEEAMSGRAEEAEARAAAAAAAQHSLSVQRLWVEERVEGLQQTVAAALQEGQVAAKAAAEERAAVQQAAVESVQRQAGEEAAGLRVVLEAAQEQLAEQQGRQEMLAEQVQQQGQQLAAVAATQEVQAAQLDQARAAAEAAASAQGSWAEQAAAAAAQRLESLEAQQAAAAERQAGAEGMLKQALTVWQRGLEEQMGALEQRLVSQAGATSASHQQLAARFEEYKGYVKRLRREVAEARAEQASSSHPASRSPRFPHCLQCACMCSVQQPPDCRRAARVWERPREDGAGAGRGGSAGKRTPAHLSGCGGRQLRPAPAGSVPLRCTKDEQLKAQASYSDAPAS